MVADMEAERAKQSLLELIKLRDKVESDLRAFKEILDSSHVGMSEPLVDSDGFPRNDIDVYQVRHTRHKIICLQNDHKALMKQIEAGLHQVHSLASNNTEEIAHIASGTQEIILSEPFLKVNIVSSGSPAEIAGIQEGDLIMEFGSIDSRNFKSLRDIGELVERSRHKPVFVKVKRGVTGHVLTLLPKPWSGNGLLGCNVVTVESVER
ncbi:26S proteasome non-ATPase regulatory subunit 9 [Athalia rosae]|uniref:26S proteasome non-ATPase regulatory subunit 9 n=1 Tax=Athalia rosae TaxID=37344 RepID=UPI0006254311|nr:26S proteasome non-ATPase regulatory subunit 9 [Athalia rosae]